MALAPDRPVGYLTLGYYQRFVLHDYTRALDQYARGLRLAPGNADLLVATANAERSLGRWEAAVEHHSQAERLDPRSANNAMIHGVTLLWLRRYPEARKAFDRGLALAPVNLVLIEQKAITFLGEGDLAGARAVLPAAPKEVEPIALVVWLANIYDLVWVLDEPQRDLLLRLTPSAFDDHKQAWGICLAQAYALKGDTANVRAYAEERGRPSRMTFVRPRRMR